MHASLSAIHSPTRKEIDFWGGVVCECCFSIPSSFAVVALTRRCTGAPRPEPLLHARLTVFLVPIDYHELCCMLRRGLFFGGRMIIFITRHMSLTASLFPLFSHSSDRQAIVWTPPHFYQLHPFSLNPDLISSKEERLLQDQHKDLERESPRPLPSPCHRLSLCPPPPLFPRVPHQVVLCVSL